MNLRRVFVLLGKEVLHGPKNFMFLMALVLPVVLTLVVSLVFGTFFSGRARLGITDQGDSQLLPISEQNDALLVSTFTSPAELEAAVGRGAVDVGVVLPADFDQQVSANALAKLTVYVWGESHMQNRIILSAAVVRAVRQIAGQEVPVEIVPVTLGSGLNIPWEQRLLPLIVLMTVLMAGTMVPSTSLVNEKMKRTLSAVAVSPATILDVFTAKGLLGAMLSVFTALLILFLNRAFGGHPALLVGVLILGATFSASIGVLLGALVKDINTLFATIKGMGLFLYAPGFVYMFPELPQWIGKIFPTYYIIQPVLEITQENAGLAEVAFEVAVLAGLTLLSFVVLVWLARQVQEKEATV
jgi:ABC-2 type transport system permease protein